LDRDWVWIFIFEKKWIRTGSGFLFDFYNEIFLRAIQEVTNDCGRECFLNQNVLFLPKIQNDFVSMRCAQARNQLGTPGGAKSFPRWAQIF